MARSLTFLLATALLVGACSADTSTVTAPADGTPTAQTVASPEATTTNGESDRGDTQSATATPTTAAPTATPEAPPPPSAPVSLDWVLGFDPSGSFAYEALGNPWEDRRLCIDEPREAVIGIDLAASEPDRLVGFVAGLELVGGAERLVFDTDGLGIVLSSCGEYPDETRSLTAVRLDARGRLEQVAPPLILAAEEDEHGFWLSRASDGAALVEVTVGGDEPDAIWTSELRRIDPVTGDSEVVDVVVLDESPGRLETPIVTSPDGRFRYRAIDDPAGQLGCEGYGIAASIGIDRGDGFEPIWETDQPGYSNIVDMQFGPDDLIAWTSSCEGYSSLYVGRVLDDGSIVDHHVIDTFDDTQADGGFAEFRNFRLNSDGVVVALGQQFVDDDYDNPIPVLRRFDLADDPDFVTTGSNPAWIDTANPLLPTLAGTGEWFVGDAPEGWEGGCGDQTLYASTSAGFVRGLSRYDEVDSVVHMVVSDERVVEYFDGASFRTRAVVVLTECPDEYFGRQLWYGEENEIPANGIWLIPADLPTVADVLSVRQEARPNDEFGVDTIVEVVYRDGSIEEVTFN